MNPCGWFLQRSFVCSISAARTELPDRIGNGTWALDNTIRKGPYLVARAANNMEGLPPFQTASSYYWEDEHTLKLLLGTLIVLIQSLLRYPLQGTTPKFLERLNPPEKLMLHFG